MSYFQSLGLRQEPFSTSPDPGFFYQSPQHKAVFFRLRTAIELRRGLSVVLGDVGTGKTTLSRKLSLALADDRSIIPVMSLQPFYETDVLFLQEMCRRFGVRTRPGAGMNVPAYLQEIEKFLFDKCVREKKNAVLLIDEAQKLTDPCLEILRSLLNYETNEHKTLQLVLLGQMELLPRLERMANFFDRIACKAVIAPLDEESVRRLVDFRVRQAGYTHREPLFTEAALGAVYAATLGYRRKVSMLCHDALERVVMRSGTHVLYEDVEAALDVQRAWRQPAHNMQAV